MTQEEIMKMYQLAQSFDKKFEDIRNGLPVLVENIKQEEDIETLRYAAKETLKLLIITLESVKESHEFLKLLLKSQLEERK